MTYVLGTRVLAEVNNGGTISYLLTDGHGSTRGRTDSSGNVITSAAPNTSGWFTYDAFGGAIGNWSLGSAGTVFLFGGDAVYDPTSGLYMHGDGTRDRQGFEFIQMDPLKGSNQDPTLLHKYLYGGADPIDLRDPSGYDELSDQAFQLADEYRAEELAGLGEVDSYVGSNANSVLTAESNWQLGNGGGGLLGLLGDALPTAVVFDLPVSFQGQLPILGPVGIDVGVGLEMVVGLQTHNVAFYDFWHIGVGVSATPSISIGDIGVGFMFNGTSSNDFAGSALNGFVDFSAIKSLLPGGVSNLQSHCVGCGFHCE